MDLREETKREEQEGKISGREGWLTVVLLVATGFLIYFLGYCVRHG